MTGVSPSIVNLRLREWFLSDGWRPSRRLVQKLLHQFDRFSCLPHVRNEGGTLGEPGYVNITVT